MRGRNWVGVAFIFLFLPVNVPLWDIVFQKLSIDIMAVFITPLLFFLGILLVFYPSRKDKISTIPSNRSNEEE
ncbi:MAG TPA: hypothetical protein EYN58_05895 [Candidatus Poseidoniales archaeon]|jgi:hypothetical protein|nr:MAG: hypothetical protein CXX81_24160 [Euryarchaeota archaeon]HHZ74689.1 hypothetical protein [Candidatus Poseidoniales archaeon]PXY76232.1 MAG: hypothetical protein CXX81_15655 [Euryarchaeota archaeon]PXY77002.1 MAG: hypothetical protein CXX81_13215 [Euryarchaeota archaeon]PXY78833.1 MAG: hypothetical protein CXX81_05820 [Euryarchaeota archaeon]